MNISLINSYFNHVYVLNLEERTEQKVTMLQKLSRLGIKAEFVEAANEYSSQNRLEHQHYLEQPIGGKGCHPLEAAYQRKLIQTPRAWAYLKTYIGILDDAKKRGFERILCLDDNVLFHCDFERRFKQAIDQIPDDWKLLYLGASQRLWKLPENLSYPDENKTVIDFEEPFYFPRITDGSFAIGIHRSVFDLLIADILKMNCPFDSGPLQTVITAHPKNCFVITPNIIAYDVSENKVKGFQNQKKLSQNLKWNMDDYDYPFQKDLVSVIIPAYNAARTIEKAIRSILMQTYEHLEIIVVDDASSDDTSKIVRKIMLEDTRVFLITLKKNQGVGRAKNAGIKAAKGKIIAFQDADDISLQKRIERQLIPIYAKGVLFSVGLIYRSRCSSKELNIDDQEAMMELIQSRQKKDKKGQYAYEDRAILGWATMIFKRKTFEQYGLFDEHRFGEDLEFIERIFYYKLGRVFNEDYNGHTFVRDYKSIPFTFQRVDKVLYVCPALTEQNLTTQYEYKRKENILNNQKFRKKITTKGLEIFPKLHSIDGISKHPLSITYNTLSLNSFVVITRVEYQMLLQKSEQFKKMQKQQSVIEDLYNSMSWRITAPLRKLLYLIQKIRS